MIKICKGAVIKFLLISILICIPGHIMAQSENSIEKDIMVESKGYHFSLEDANRLKIVLKDPIVYKGEPIVFYVNLEGARWLDAINTTVASRYFTAATFKKVSETKLEIKIANSISRSTYYIPLLTELIGGEAKVSIDSNETEITDMSSTGFAITSDQKAAVFAGERVGIRDEGVVANIRIDEIIKGSLTESNRQEDRVITLTLLNPNYEFENDRLVVTPSRGYFDMLGITTNYLVSNNKSNKEVIRINIPQRTDVKTQGRFNISEIKLKAKSKKLQLGEIQIKVSGSRIHESVVTVAEVMDYGIEVINRSPASLQIKSGSKRGISFSIKEQVLDSMITGKTVQVTLDKGYFSPRSNASITDLTMGKIMLNNQDITKFVPVREIVKDGFLIGFSFEIPKNLDNTKLNEIRFDSIEIYAPTNTTGAIQVFVGAEGIKDQASAQVASIKPVSVVNIEPIRLKVGLKDQVGGKITITETDKDMINEGVIELEIETDGGIAFEKEPTVTVISGDIKLGDVRYDGIKKSMLKIEVLRTSKNASVIEIKNFLVTTDRTVPDGGYKLTVKGSALVPDTTLGTLEYNNFMVIGEMAVNMPVVPINPKIISKFIIDSEAYDVNGEKRNMDAKAYLEAGRTMVPLRYVADAVGIMGKDIQFINGMITITAPGKVITLYNGESAAKINGQEVFISGKVVIKDGRTYVPVAEIARLLGIKVTWESDTRMAIFEK